MLRPITAPAACLIVLATALALSPASLAAREYGVGVRAGSHGLGAEGAIGVTQWFSVRGGFYGADVSRDFEEGGINYDGDLTLGGFGVMADFFPLRGRFHLSVGLLSNENQIDFSATPTENQTVGGTTYTPAQIGTLLGKVEFESTAPYAGVGWGNLARGRKIGFVFDIGVLAQGAGDVSMSSSSPLVSDSDLREEERQIEEDISEYDLWPIISLGVAIRF